MLLVALLVGLCMPVMAQSTTSTIQTTKTFGEQDYNNSAITGLVDDVISYSGISGTVSQNPSMGSSYSGYCLQLYKNNHLVIKSENTRALITGITITLQSRYSNTGDTWSVISAKNASTSLNNVTVSRNRTSVTVNLNSQSASEVILAVGSQANISSITFTYTYLLEEPTISVTSAAGTELTKGQVTILETTSNSTGTVSYTSNNTSVATVSSTGVVSTVGIGEVTLTASVAAAGRFKAGSASIKITVKEPEPDPNAWTADSLLTIPGVEPEADGKTMYYIKNVGTGLNISYGGEWGTHCIESQSAHPLILEDNGDGTVAIASLAGYLESNTLWMDSTKYSKDNVLVSKWRFVPVDDYPGQYYIIGDYDRYLSSVGNKSGLLVLKSNEGKAFQRWIFTSGPDIRGSLMPHASAELPLDVTVAIRGASFDVVDDYEANSRNAIPAFKNTMMPYHETFWNNYEDYVDKEWWNNRVGDWNPTSYNHSGVFNNLNGYITYDMTLPPGAYRFTLEGFYRRNSNYTMTASVSLLNKNTSQPLSEASTITLSRNGNVEYNTDAGHQAAAIAFRDDDNWQKEATFFISDTTEVQIRVSGNASSSVVYLDNFNLYYTGFPSVAPDYVAPPIDLGLFGYTTYLVWDKERQGYICYSDADIAELLPYINEDVIETKRVTATEVLQKKDEAIRNSEVYDALVEASKPVIQNALDNADDNIIYKNYLNANINAYKKLLNDAGKEKLISKLEELQVYPDNINSRLEYYDAIAKLEEAFEYAKIADAIGQEPDDDDDIIDYSGAIFNPSFEFGDLYHHGEARGWTIAEGYTAQTFIVQNADKTYTTKGIDGACLFNNWWTGTHLTQTVTDLPAGTYILSALIASNDPTNVATIYLTGNDNKRGVNPPNVPYITKDKGADGKDFLNHRNNAAEFGDFSLKVEVPNTSNGKGSATVGIIGGDDDDTPENPIGSYNPNGHWWYKCDNFRLEYLPKGVLTLKDDATKIYNLIDELKVKVVRTIKANKKWSSFVVPFDMEIPNNWEVKEFIGGTVRTVVDEKGVAGDNINLNFSTASKIEAGKPYMIRLKDQSTEVSSFQTTGEAEVNTTLPTTMKKSVAGDEGETVTGEYDVEFVGVYTSGKIPNSYDENGQLKDTQYYFISDNKFYRSKGDNNTIKGFRGYFKVDTTKPRQGTSGARGLRGIGMQIQNETDIENVADNEEVKVIGIYNVNGVKLESMQPGINILRMNNGTTKKVMVK